MQGESNMQRIARKTLIASQRGFTLLELLAVMAIVAVLAGIVTTSISGTGDASRDAQATQDSTTVDSASADYFSDQGGSEILTSVVDPILDLVPDPDQITSSRWPELAASNAYPNVFRANTNVVTGINFVDENGNLIEDDTATADVIEGSVDELLTGFTAIDFTTLIDGGYMTEAPNSVGETSSDFANYLWLFEKTDAAGSASENGSRNVAVYKLVSAAVDTTDPLGDTAELTYQRIG